MVDYISRPALMGKLTSSDMQQKIKAMSGADAYNEFLTLVNGAEKADVAPVWHGRWEWKNTDEFTQTLTCSACGRSEYASESNKFCPSCGARMDGGTADGIQ